MGTVLIRTPDGDLWAVPNSESRQFLQLHGGEAIELLTHVLGQHCTTPILLSDLKKMATKKVRKRKKS